MSAVPAAANPFAPPFDLDALGRWLGHHLPGFTGLRHERNSSVGIMDKSPTAIKTENFVMNEWLWK